MHIDGIDQAWLHTLANNNLVGSDCQKTTHGAIIPPYQNMSESITANKVF